MTLLITIPDSRRESLGILEITLYVTSHYHCWRHIAVATYRCCITCNHLITQVLNEQYPAYLCRFCLHVIEVTCLDVYYHYVSEGLLGFLHGIDVNYLTHVLHVISFITQHC